METNSVANLLTSVDSLFTTQTERDAVLNETVINIPLTKICDFPNHPFQVRMDKDMEEMVESIRKYGVLLPALVRPKENGTYEMIAGHRRKKASELAGKTEISCIVRDMTDDEAILLMVDSNLQRETILPSEKAFAYKMKLDAMKRQAGRPRKNNSVPVAQNFEGKTSRQILSEQIGESQDQIRRYICLTNLLPELLDMVDNSVLKEKGILQMALRPAVELSYLTKTEQRALQEVITREDCVPSYIQAMKLRKFSQEGRLNSDVILSIMQEQKPNQVEKLKISNARIAKFFPTGTSAQKIEDTIVKALELYRKHQRRIER